LFARSLTRPPTLTLCPYTTLFRSWNRQGGSVQTALPQLEEQVQEQNEWRILLVGDEDAVRTRNPFDIARSDQAADYARCAQMLGDRKSTRLNSSHVSISYAVFCLK